MRVGATNAAKQTGASVIQYVPTKLLASGQADPFMQGCLSTISAIRNLRHQVVPKEMFLKPSVIDKTNYWEFDKPVEARSCPKWEDAGSD